MFQVSPLVQVVTADGERTFPFADIALDGDDPATISDGDLVQRAERWMDLNPGSLRGYQVSRPSTGNLLIAPKPTFGGEPVQIVCDSCPDYPSEWDEILNQEKWQ